MGEKIEMGGDVRGHLTVVSLLEPGFVPIRDSQRIMMGRQ